MKKSLFVSLAAALAFSTFTTQQATAQNSSPYWSVYGNSNATTYQKVGTTNAYPLRLITNNSTRIYIGASNGYVGIGTTSPSSRLHVNAASGTSPFKVQINGSTKLYVSSGGGLSVGSGSSAPTNGLYVAGNVGIGTNTPAYKLQVNGTSSFSNQLTVGDGGVYGYNSGGPGVYAKGSSYGLYATTSGDYGVYATATGNYGVYATGANYGVAGVGSIDGLVGSGYYGLSASSTNANGYGALTYGGYGGTYGSGTQYGVYGYSGNNYGVYGWTAGGGSGTANTGVYGYCNSTGYGTAGYCVSGSGIYGYSQNYVGVWGATGNSSSWAGYFVGKVYSSGGFTSSDRKLKKDITDVSGAMDIINKLQPKSYTFRQDGNYKLMNLPQGKHFGLIAQDVEQLLPNLVSEAEFDTKLAQPGVKEDPKAGPTQQAPTQTSSEIISFKALNYTELIPIIVKGMQEQSELIKQQQQQINDLKDQISRLTGNSNILTSAGTLGQNSPNPVRTTTRISYSVPNNSRAQLLLTDALGKTIKVLSLNNSGYVNFNATGLSSGMYNYSLMVDGKIVETKKMEIVR